MAAQSSDTHGDEQASLLKMTKKASATKMMRTTPKEHSITHHLDSETER